MVAVALIVALAMARQRVQLQRALPRSLWRALRRAALWMAGRRHLPVLLTVGTGEGFPDARPDV